MCLIEMIILFFKKTTPKGKNRELNTLSKVGKHYLNNTFLHHLIPMLPLQFIQWDVPVGGQHTYLYFLLVKTYRLVDGLDCYDVPKIMSFIKQRNLNRIINIIQTRPDLRENQILPETNHNIGQCLIIKYALDTFKLIIMIFTSSYVLGCGWLMICQIQEQTIDGVDYDTWKDADIGGETETLDDDHPYAERFVIYFDLKDASPMYRLITVTYFGFTSLSTVGLGDYHPRSDFERVLTAFILLIGVALFSIIMGEFCEILEEFQHFHDDIDNGD